VAPKNKDYLVIHHAADAKVPAVSRAVLSVWDGFRSSLDPGALATQLQTKGTVDLDWTKLQTDFRAAVVPILGGVARTAALRTIPLLQQQMQEWWKAHPPKKFSFAGAAQSSEDAWYNVGFNLQDKSAEDFLRSYLPTLITRETNQTRDAVRNIVLNGFQQAVHPYRMALQIQDIVGMNGPQADQYARFIMSGATDAQAATFATNLIHQRSELIARTETLRAANTGQVDMWSTAMEHGLLKPQTTLEVWIITPDDRLCPDCAEMEDQTQVVQGTFDGGNFGPLGNPPLHPDCRCTLGLEFTDLPPFTSAAPTNVSLPENAPEFQITPPAAALSPVSQQIQDLYNQGMAKADIAKQVGVPYQKVWQVTKHLPTAVPTGISKVLETPLLQPVNPAVTAKVEQFQAAVQGLFPNLKLQGIEKLDLQVLPGFQDAMQTFATDFPQFTSNLTSLSVGDLRASVMAETGSGLKESTMVLNAGQWAAAPGAEGNWMSTLSKAAKDKWFASGAANPQGVMMHELGHTIEYKLGDYAAQIGSADARLAYANMREAVMQMAHLPIKDANLISGYARKSMGESFAEMFSAHYYTPKELYSPIMKDFDTAFEKYLAATRGTAAEVRVAEPVFKDLLPQLAEGSRDSLPEAIERELATTLPRDPVAVDGLRQYTASAYKGVNKYLRHGETVTPYIRNIAAHMDRAFAESKGLPFDVLLRRGSGTAGHLSELIGQDLVDQIQEAGGARIEQSESQALVRAVSDKLTGRIISDSGYVSTSVGGGFGTSLRYVIQAPKGTKGIFVDPISAHKGEFEVILNRGTQLAVTGVKWVPYSSGYWGYIQVMTRVVQPV
jgi:hypothetical protein